MKIKVTFNDDRVITYENADEVYFVASSSRYGFHHKNTESKYLVNMLYVKYIESLDK